MKSHIRQNLKNEDLKIGFIKLKLEGVSSNTTYYNKDETNTSPTNTRTHSIILKTIIPETTKGRD